MKYILIISAIILAVLAYDAARMYFLFQKTLALEHLTAFNRVKSGASFRVLVLGDSTAVGTGSDIPEHSIAGRLGDLYPDAEILNYAENGLRIAGLEEILKKIPESEHFDIVLIQIGANDIFKLTPMKDVGPGINRILARSKLFGGKVIVLHSGNIGESTFFPWYLGPFLTKRSYEMRDIYKKAAAQEGAQYVDLIDSPIPGILKQSPDKYYANDQLHLSGDGYALWYAEILKKL